MAVKASPQATVTDSATTKLSINADTAPGTGSAAYQRDYGSTLVISTSGPLHFGGTTGTNNTGVNRGALLPAGFYSFDLSGDDDIYARAPSGQTVTVEILQLGV